MADDSIAEAEYLTVILLIADARTSGLSRSYRRAVESQREEISLEELVEALRAGAPAAIAGAITLDTLQARFEPEFLRTLLGIAVEAGPVVASQFANATGVELGEEAVVFAAESWARRHSASMVRDLVDENRDTVRDIVADALRERRAVEDTAETLRDVVGLNQTQAHALNRARQEWIAEGLSKERVRMLAESYRRRLVAHRANVIARNETMLAVNEAQRNLWKLARQSGAIRASEWEREWVGILGDGRICIRCWNAHGTRAPLDGAYPNGSFGPLLHTLCRCHEKLVQVAVAASDKPPWVEPSDGGTLRPAA